MSRPEAALTAAADLLGSRAQHDEPLGARTTYRVGGRAALLVVVDDDAGLDDVARAVAASGVPVVIVGNGSNMLVADRGYAGLAVVLGDGFAELTVDRFTVRAGGAVRLPTLARRTAALGLTGLEWAVGVPGSVGGAVRMNAGGHGSDIAASLHTAGVVDLATGERRELDRSALAFAYRHSSVAPTQVVSWARFTLASGDRLVSEGEINEIVRWRREHQPGGQNAGSVFTNPENDSAGRLIDSAGLKGFRVGTAEVSERHANFIQADPDGSADDVLALIREVQRRVEEATGVRLEPELRLIGFAP